jgi:hypothetical protein
MATIARISDFQPNTVISSATMNSELNNIVNLLKGTDTSSDVYIGGSTPPTGGTPKLMVVGASHFVLPGSGTTLALYREGDAAASPRMSISNLGNIRMVASGNLVSPSVQTMVLDGVLYCYNGGSTVLGGAVGNVGAGEDDLMNFDIAENVMNGQQQFIEIFAAGKTAANANNKRIRFYVKTTAVLDSGSVAFNNMPWHIRIKIFSYGGLSEVMVVGEFVCDTTTVRCCTVVSAFDHTTTNTTKTTGLGVATDDIIQSVLLVRKGMSA